MSIIIDPEFQVLIPPLSADEYTQLEKNIVKDGIRDALVVWPQADGNDILIDGHNRFNISASHSGIQFQIKRKDFRDRDEAIVWIIDNQLGKRNLPVYDKVKLNDKKREALARIAKKKIGGDKRSAEYKESSARNHANEKTAEDRSGRTDYKIAKAAGTSEDTVRKVRTIENKAPDSVKQQVRSGEKSINQAWLEIKEKERKQADLSARASLRKAEERHEDFQSKENASFTDRLQDQEDLSEIAKSKSREIRNTVKKIIFWGASDADFSMITKKTVGEHELKNLLNDLSDSIAVLTKILGIVRR